MTIPEQTSSTSSLQKILLDQLYRSRAGYRLFCLLAERWDGGEFYSQVWRRLLLKYDDVEVGTYTYGPVLHRGRMPRGTRIGRWCSVGRDLLVRRRDHPIERVTQHPFFYNARHGMIDRDAIPGDADNPLTIGHDVWIGDRVMILSGCRHIGNGAVIAGGSVVTKDVPAYAIMAGVPARLLRPRFPPEVQVHLEESRWWELDHVALAQLAPMLLEPLDEVRAAAFKDRCLERRTR